MNRRRGQWGAGAAWVAAGLLAAGCGPKPPPPYRDGTGLHFTQPRGWVERARADAAGGEKMEGALAGQRKLPLPPLARAGGGPREHLVVQYERVESGNQAWLRVTEAEAPAATPLESCLAGRAPPGAWKRATAPEQREVGGRPAVRLALAGRHDGQDYVCETTAVRQGGKVYFFTASVPADDAAGRDEVRQAVSGAAWD
jgi:hypothetical protein